MLFQHTKEYSMDTALEADLLTRMQEVNILLCQWLNAAAIWKWQEEKHMEMAAWAVKVVLIWVAKIVSSDKQEQIPMAKSTIESVVSNPVQELADELPTIKLPSKEQKFVSSVGQKQKVSRTFDVID